MEENFDVDASDGANVNVDNPLAAMQPGEKVVCQIKRHPIGMLSKYISTALALIVLAIIIVLVLPQVVSPDSLTKAKELSFVGVLFVAALSGLGLYVSAYVYYRNRWIVTSDSITQVNQMSLFSAQTSQLSMANLQDVTVIQDGIMQTMFNYGMLRAETAGERSKFIFIYCPNPKRYAQAILMARENFINASPETAKRANDDLAVPRGPLPTNGLSVPPGSRQS
jgi:hypothetical protein